MRQQDALSTARLSTWHPQKTCWRYGDGEINQYPAIAEAANRQSVSHLVGRAANWFIEKRIPLISPSVTIDGKVNCPQRSWWRWQEASYVALTCGALLVLNMPDFEQRNSGKLFVSHIWNVGWSELGWQRVLVEKSFVRPAYVRLHDLPLWPALSWLFSSVVHYLALRQKKPLAERRHQWAAIRYSTRPTIAQYHSLHSPPTQPPHYKRSYSSLFQGHPIHSTAMQTKLFFLVLPIVGSALASPAANKPVSDVEYAGHVAPKTEIKPFTVDNKEAEKFEAKEDVADLEKRGRHRGCTVM